MPNLPYYSSSGVAASAPFGGITVTINAITYRAVNWKPEKNTRKIRRNDSNGDQGDFTLRAEPTTQSGLTLQMALASTAVPSLGQEFTVDTLVYVLTKVGAAKQEGEFWTVDVDYESKVLTTD
jgi:hypothetical protein